MANKYTEEFKEKIREIYETTDVSLNQLAKDKYIGKATIIKWAKDYKWAKVNKPTDQENLKKTDRPNDVLGPLEKDIIKKVITEEEKKIKTGRKFKGALTQKEKEFIRNYFSCRFNVALATYKSGYADVNSGYTVLKKPKIKNIIERIKLTMEERDPLRLNSEFIIEELVKNHYRATGAIVQTKTEIVKNKTKKPVSVVQNGRQVTKYVEEEISEPLTYAALDTDIKASNQSLMMIAKIKGFDDLAREKLELEKAKNNENLEVDGNISFTFKNNKIKKLEEE